MFAVRGRRRGAVVGVAIAVAGSLSSCAVPVAAAPAPSPTPTEVAPYGDGELVIGSLLPLTGDGADAAAGAIAGIELAVRDINDAGGVAGTPVRTFHRGTGDASPSALEAAFDELIGLGVDVIVGPAEAVTGDAVVALATAARVAIIELDHIDADSGEAPPESFVLRLRSADPGIVDASLGPAAYDASTIAALAAVRSGDDGGESIARAIPDVLTPWVPCGSFAECAAALESEPMVEYRRVAE